MNLLLNKKEEKKLSQQAEQMLEVLAAVGLIHIIHKPTGEVLGNGIIRVLDFVAVPEGDSFAVYKRIGHEKL